MADRPHLTLEQLRIFVAVAEHQHVTNAARAINLTQSTISAAISALEARFSVALFDRIGRRIALNSAGERFLEEARLVLAKARDAENVLADLAGLRRGQVSVAASQTVANYWLPKRLTSYRKHFPDIDLNVMIGNTEKAVRLVSSGAVELAVVEGVVEDPALSVATVSDDELVMIAPLDHPWSKQPSGKPIRLGESNWVARERGSGTREEFDRLLAAAGVASPRIAFEFTSNEAVCSAVEAGAGAAIVPMLVAANALSTGAVAKVEVPVSPRRYFLVTLHGRTMSNAAASVRDYLTGADPDR